MANTFGRILVIVKHYPWTIKNPLSHDDNVCNGSFTRDFLSQHMGSFKVLILGDSVLSR